MNTSFHEISRTEWFDGVQNADSPFLSAAFEDELKTAFPYITFKYFLYKEEYLVRLAVIGGRVTTVPFSDGGDVVALAKTPLSLRELHDECLKHFGNAFTLRVHGWFCPVVDPEGAVGDIIDFRISLSDFDVSSIRKTLRHIVSASLPQDVEIRKAVSERDIRSAYHLYLKTMKEAHALALPMDAFRLFLAHDVFLFLEHDVVRGMSVFLNGVKTHYYFISATNERGKELHAAHYLLFHALTTFRVQGAEAVLLGGTRTDGSLRTFKEGWRGDPYTLYTVSAQSAHERGRKSPLRSLWGLIPAPLLPKASKFAGKYFF